ncbi:MAG: ABC transporter ATP-binding protein [Anaerolineae bacterium]
MSASGDEPYIALRGLTKHFRLGSQTVRALNDADLSVGQGEFVVVMGPSGSGKSTLLNLVGGLDRPTSGTITVAGYEISSLDEIDLARYRRRMVGFVFQSFNLISTMTALRNVEFPMVFAGVAAADRHRRARRLLESVGLSERTDHRPNELSGGEQQRVAIARALANRPPLLLGDEPTGNLDTRTGGEVMEILAQLNQLGHTLLVVSHDRRLAEYADRVVVMEDGHMLGEVPGGDSTELGEPRAVAAGYGSPAGGEVDHEGTRDAGKTTEANQ